jgi:hypothetical protein
MSKVDTPPYISQSPSAQIDAFSIDALLGVYAYGVNLNAATEA